MKIKSKPLYKEWGFIILAWILLIYFYYIIAVWGTIKFWQPNILTEYSSSWKVHLEIIIQGLFFGFLFALINYFFDRTALRKRSLVFIISIKSLLYILSLILVGTLINLIYVKLRIIPSEEAMAQLFAMLEVNYVISVVFFMSSAIVLINFMLQVSRKFGPGNLIKIFTGKYSIPQIEERIFLFLDLRSSTTIAEKLGHHKYSKLLQDCFHDLTDIVLRYNAEIYQYVGDEVVLSWILPDGIRNYNCLKAFFAYELKLNSKHKMYMNRYGLFPEFRGGMDAGQITTAEVGDIKREIAFHGDVLNTASRLQGQCKKYNKKLLISNNLASRFPTSNGFEKIPLGEIILRGKEKKVEVIAVELI